jgi:phage terminase large subunit
MSMPSLEIEAQIPGWARKLKDPARYKVMFGGRGGGKSWTIARALLLDGLENPGRVLCARETMKSMADSVHEVLSKQIQAMNLGGRYEVLANEIRGIGIDTHFGYAGLRTQGITNIKSWEGARRCWVEEAQVVTKKSWEVLTPTIRATGSEIWIGLNPELDTDYTYTEFVLNPQPDSIIIPVNWRDNPWLTDVLEKERLAKLERDPEGYKNIWEGKCRAAVEGAIYASEIEAMQLGRRIATVPYDPLLPVHTIWDLGWNDLMVILMVQRAGSELRLIGCIMDNLRTLDSYVSELTALGYRWGTDWIPHDGRTKNTHTGKSTEEMLKSMQRRVQIVPQIGVEDGIKAARMMFPRIYMDKGCTDLLNSLKRYKRVRHTNGTFGAPLHDDASHGADAWRYLAVIADRLSNDSETAHDFTKSAAQGMRI